MAEHYSWEKVASVHVLTLALPRSVDGVEFDRLNESLLELLVEHSNKPWVLAMDRNQHTGSALLGTIVNLRQRIRTGGGKLVLCGLSPQLAEIFRACSIERLFTITKTREDAIKLLK